MDSLNHRSFTYTASRYTTHTWVNDDKAHFPFLVDRGSTSFIEAGLMILCAIVNSLILNNIYCVILNIHNTKKKQVDNENGELICSAWNIEYCWLFALSHFWTQFTGKLLFYCLYNVNTRNITLNATYLIWYGTIKTYSLYMCIYICILHKPQIGFQRLWVISVNVSAIRYAVNGYKCCIENVQLSSFCNLRV